MPTNDERREVAARLRERAAMRCRYSHQDPDLLGCLVTNLTKPHCGESTIGNVLSRLADLIEPEPERTCRNGATGSDFECSECGCRVIGSAYWTEANICDGDWSFCPNCGARVKEGA